MPYLGSRTVADCQRLALVLHPKVRGLRAAFDRVRPQWEARDLFGAQRYARDLSHLEARWRTAVKAAQKVRVSAKRDASTTFADKAHDKMVRAVRQRGEREAPHATDLSVLSKRLQRVYGKLRPAAFGYDAADPYGSAMTAGGAAGGLPSDGSGLTKSVADCAALVGRYGDAVTRAVSASGRGPCADWNTALMLLAIKAGDPTLATQSPEDFARLVASNEDSASTPADEVYSLLVKVIGDWLPGGAFGIDLTVQGLKDAASSAYDSVTTGAGNAASTAYNAVSDALPSAQSVKDAASTAYNAVSDALPSAQSVKDAASSAASNASQAAQDAWQSTKDSYEAAKTSLKREVDDEVDRITKPATDAVPWIKGAVVVAGVGAIGYALAQIATLTSGLRRSA